MTMNPEAIQFRSTNFNWAEKQISKTQNLNARTPFLKLLKTQTKELPKFPTDKTPVHPRFYHQQKTQKPIMHTCGYLSRKCRLVDEKWPWHPIGWLVGINSTRGFVKSFITAWNRHETRGRSLIKRNYRPRTGRVAYKATVFILRVNRGRIFCP